MFRNKKDSASSAESDNSDKRIYLLLLFKGQNMIDYRPGEKLSTPNLHLSENKAESYQNLPAWLQSCLSEK